ncbi:MAG: DUF4180 domain-containing protein [Bacteroidales bacterium]|nr:DUF4180 domain-containing protein [Bacteroidales bacterium]
MIKYHTCKNGRRAAEINIGNDLIYDSEQILDLMAEALLNDAEKIVIHSHNLHPDFFDLKTGIAGEMLQKFSNYRMRLAIIGDFSGYKSKSLGDFIRESNRTGIVSFKGSINEALG